MAALWADCVYSVRLYRPWWAAGDSFEAPAAAALTAAAAVDTAAARSCSAKAVVDSVTHTDCLDCLRRAVAVETDSLLEEEPQMNSLVAVAESMVDTDHRLAN